MELLYIIAGLVVIGLLTDFYKKRKANNSPYLKIKRKLENDLMQAKFSGDWKMRQDINLKLLWLKSFYDTKSKVLSRSNHDNDDTSIVRNFSDEEIKFPTKWKLDDFYSYPFSQEILAAYRKVLAENDYQGIYKPNNILPVPKEFIIKAIYFTFDYLNMENPKYKIADKDKLAENLNLIYAFLDISFINTGDADLPKESEENLKVGNVFKDEQEVPREIEYQKLIDWRTDNDWIVKSVKYADKKQYDYAFVCLDQAKKINPDRPDLKSILATIYLTQGEEFFENGKMNLAFENIRKSAELQNEEATRWLKEHKTNLQ